MHSKSNMGSGMGVGGVISFGKYLSELSHDIGPNTDIIKCACNYQLSCIWSCVIASSNHNNDILDETSGVIIT